MAHLSFFERWDSTSLSRLGFVHSADATKSCISVGTSEDEKEARRCMSPRLPTFAKTKAQRWAMPKPPAGLPEAPLPLRIPPPCRANWSLAARRPSRHQGWSAEIAGYRSARVLCSRDQRRARQFDALRSYQDHSLRAMAPVASTWAECSFARRDNRGSRLSSSG